MLFLLICCHNFSVKKSALPTSNFDEIIARKKQNE